MTTPSHHYQAYGLSIDSDLELPELLPDAARATPVGALVTIRAESVPPAGLEGATHTTEHLQCTPKSVWLNIPNVGRMIIRDGCEIGYELAAGVTYANMRVYLLGSGLGTLLIQRGLIVMHGNAIDMGTGCLTCVGLSGVGKSTTATGMMQRGYPLIADDVCPVDAQRRVIPGMPHVKIWQETADALGILTPDLPAVAPDLPKYRLPMRAAFSDQPLPLRLLVELCPSDVTEVHVTPVTGPKKIALIQQNMYRYQIVHGMQLGAVSFRHAAERFSGVKAFRVERPAEGFDLDNLLDTLVQLFDDHAQVG
ncbi:hypothetical protein [Gymnodinialimonas sp.]